MEEELLDLSEVSSIVITDDEGNDKEYTILFTFESDEFERKYVLYYDEEQDEPEVIYNIYDDEGHLYPVETPEEMDMIEEVFNTFMLDDENE